MTRPAALVLLAGLLFGAIVATVADGAAYLSIIGSGRAAEVNPLIAQMSQPVALWAKFALVVLIVSLAVLSRLVASRALRFTVGVVLVVAIVAGFTGALTTVGAA